MLAHPEAPSSTSLKYLLLLLSAGAGLQDCLDQRLQMCLCPPCSPPMLQPLFQIKGKCWAFLAEAFSFFLSYLPVFPGSVLLSITLNVIFVMLKMHILYLKMQTQDHFWSRTYSEVVSLSVLIKLWYIIKITIASPHIKNIVMSAVCLWFALWFGFVAGLKSNWPVEGTVGSAEGHGGDASVSAWRYVLSILVECFPRLSVTYFQDVFHLLSLCSALRQCGEWHNCQADGWHAGGVLEQRGNDP